MYFEIFILLTSGIIGYCDCNHGNNNNNDYSENIIIGYNVAIGIGSFFATVIIFLLIVWVIACYFLPDEYKNEYKQFCHSIIHCKNPITAV